MIRSGAVLPLAFVVVFSSSCAAMLKEWQDSHCNYDAAYSDGMAAQRSGANPDAAQYGQCTPETRDVAMRGYREGYESAARARAQADAAAALEWQDANCNYDAAFAQGMNAQRSGAALEVTPYGRCPEPARSAALRGYRVGYERALRESNREPGPVIVPPPPPPPPLPLPPPQTPRLVSLGSAKCLDAGGGPKIDGTPLQLWQCNNSEAQMFALRPIGAGTVNVVHVPSGQCVDLPGAGGYDEWRMVLRRCSETPGQAFTRVEVVGGFQLINAQTGRCIDVDGNRDGDGTRILQWTCNGASNQKWTLTPRQ
jgi:Ricin-type beta-trefoil lectin domain